MSQPRRFTALATDYDGTIARHGEVSAATFRALSRWKDAGRKLLLVTGRELPDLFKVCPFTAVFDRIVAENGALLFNPSTKEQRVIAPEPPKDFVDFLRLKGVTPLSVGRTIVATNENFHGVVLEGIEKLGLKWKVVLNKGALMVLPHNVDKTTGLIVALEELQTSPADTIAVGDAENDHVFLAFCGYSAAVANALPFLKKQAHYVTRSSHGAGVEELIDRMLQDSAPDCGEHAVQQELLQPER
jgi:Predicted hydrolases of the HAD superfamily